MTEQEIINGAPNGATHYRKFSCGTRYLMLLNGVWYFWYKSAWNESTLQEQGNKCLELGLFKTI